MSQTEFFVSNWIFRLKLKFSSQTKVLLSTFFFSGTSPDLIAHVHAHIQHEHLKKRLSYFQLVCLGLTYGVFRKQWYCWIAKGKEDVLFMYFVCSRSKNKRNFICCLVKSFKTMCSPNMTECTFVSWSIILTVAIGKLPALHDLS